MARPVIHLRLAEKIRQEIALYQDGWKIASVHTLARRHGVAPNTVRKALAILAAQGDIVRPGPHDPYLRQRTNPQQRFCKPFPAVALMSFSNLSVTGSDYLAVLIASFIDTLQLRRVPVCVLPKAGQLRVDLLPGGVSIAPTGMRFSAVALRSGGPLSFLEAIIGSGTIAMGLDCVVDIPGVDSAAVDCADEAVRATAYLHGLGHRTIGFVSYRDSVAPEYWPERVDPDSRRLSLATLDAKVRLGLDATARYHVECDLDANRSDIGVRAAIDRLWRLRPVPTALICFNDMIAARVEDLLAQRDIRCPQDISILSRGSLGEPSKYTTLASDPQRMGTAAAAHLHNRLIDPSTAPAKLLFQSTLVPGTTAVPRQA